MHRPRQQYVVGIHHLGGDLEEVLHIWEVDKVVRDETPGKHGRTYVAELGEAIEQDKGGVRLGQLKLELN